MAKKKEKKKPQNFKWYNERMKNRVEFYGKIKWRKITSWLRKISHLYEIKWWLLPLYMYNVTQVNSLRFSKERKLYFRQFQQFLNIFFLSVFQLLLIKALKIVNCSKRNRFDVMWMFAQLERLHNHNKNILYFGYE